MNQFILFISALLAFYNTGYSQRKNGLPNAIIKFSPQHLCRSGIWLSAEFFASNQAISNQLSLEAIYHEPYPNTRKIEVTGFTAEYMLRFYPNKMVRTYKPKDITQGYYTAIFGQGGTYSYKVNSIPGKTKSNSSEITSSGFFPGILLGFEQRMGKGLFWDIYVGAGMRISDVDIRYTFEEEEPDFRFQGVFSGGALPKIGISLGIGI